VSAPVKTPAFDPSTWGAYPFHPAGHLGGSSPREGHEQNAARVGAIDDKMGDAMGERIGLARTRSGNNKKRHGRRACVFSERCVFDRPPLFRIKLFKIGDGHGFRISVWVGSSLNHVARVLRTTHAA